MKKRLFRWLFIGLVFFIGYIIVNTVLFPSRQIPMEPIEKIPIGDEVMERLSQSIQIPTVSNLDYIDTTAFRRLSNFIHQNYPLVDSLLEFKAVNDFSKVFRWPGKNAKLNPILLIAHMDVVPVAPDSRDQWIEAPFSGVIKDGYIWGRGTLDDKLSVFGWLETAEQLLQEGYQPERSIYFAFGHDEETSGSGAAAIAAHFASQNIRFAYVLDEAMVVVKEALPGLEAPLAMIGIAEKGYLSLNLKVQLTEGGHTMMPPPETAITILGNAINKLKEKPFPMKIDGATKELFQYAGPEMSLPFKAVFANLSVTKSLLKNQLGKDPATAAMLRTTIAPTMIRGGIKDNVLPTEASAIVNFRILPGETITSVQEYVKKAINDARVAVEVHNPDFAKNPSPVAGTNSFGFQLIHKTIRQVIPEAVVAPSLVIATTDSYQYLNVAEDVYRFTPITISREDLRGIHGINERLSVENYKQLLRFYRQLILNSCQ